MKTLYTIISYEHSAYEHKFVLELNPKNSIFEGHFPSNPLLPGACTIEIIKELTELVLDRAINFSSISSCKFVSFISPTSKGLEFIIKILDNSVLQANVYCNSQLKLKLKSKIN